LLIKCLGKQGEAQKTGGDAEIDTNAPKSHQRARQTHSKNKQNNA